MDYKFIYKTEATHEQLGRVHVNGVLKLSILLISLRTTADFIVRYTFLLLFIADSLD